MLSGWRAQLAQQRHQRRDLLGVGHLPGPLEVAVGPPGDGHQLVLAHIDTHRQGLAVPADADLADVDAIDSQAAICFALHGDDLQYAGPQRPQLQIHRSF